ncbi:MAG: heparinase II/III domain-containing protein, partial [Betaproteobacteria bacterium]
MRHHRSASPAAPLSADGGLVNALWVFLFVLFLYAGVPSVARAQNCVPGTTPDWMTADDPLAAPVRPAECSAVEQSPPDFGWPAVAGTYQLTLTYPGGATKSVTTPRNWLNWAEVLPAGTYTWQVTANGVSSRSREFTVPANATPFVVPAMSTVLSGLSSKARPRSLPDSATLATMKSQRSSAVNALLSDVKSKTRETLPGGAGGDGKVYGDAALQAIAAAAYSQQGVYYNEAVRRVTNLASWDPKGISSYASNADGAQTVALALAVGYDWLYGRLSQSQRNGILAALKVRVADMHAGVMPSEARPRDALAIQGLAKASVIAAILAHDLPEAATWLNATLPLALNLVSPWSGDDGGFSNGVAEGFQELGGQLFPWYLLRWSTGIDVAKKAWVRNWARYMTYFSPIGTPSNVFGDGLEIAMDENRARFSKGYTFFAPTPLARWYASKLSGENQTRLEYLMAPPDDGTAATFPAATPNTLLLRSTGQIAMHSDLANPARTSVYFKSSPPPHGAFDHGHADQNSFVINSGGQRLAVESGYYDSYKSAHWTDWYHQTRSKNAITYDGGKGQAYYEQGGKVGYGRIVRYVSGSDHEVVTGDATQAYGGALTKATRSMVYLRPNLIVVHDNLASDIARQWEWNIHTLNAMSVASDSKIAIENGGQKLCVEVLGGPARRFEQTDRFTTEPSGTRPRQWHGKFYSTEMLAATEFIVLLNVGCAATTASAAKSNGVWTVNVNDKAIQISDSGISVGAGSSSVPTADTTAPSVPTGLTAAAVSSSQINLNWNASTDNVAVTGYYVYLNDKPLGTTTSTSYSHTGLTA